MAVARHKKHYQPGLSTERRLHIQKVAYVAKEVEKLKRRISGMYGRRL
jgi:hypothetical protein